MKKIKISTLVLIVGFELVILIIVGVGFAFWTLYLNSPWSPIRNVPAIPTNYVTDIPAIPTINATNIPLPKPTQVQIPKADFSLPSINTVPPEDILEEITYSATGGGDAGCPILTSPELRLSEKYEWAEGIGVNSCGWKSDEPVQVTITYPNKHSESEIVNALWDGSVSLWRRSVDLPIGQYHFYLKGENGVLEDTAILQVGNTPLIYGENDLFLSGFKKHEKVRLLLYKSQPSSYMTLIGWQEYQVSETGQLVISAPAKRDQFGNCDYFYYIIGEISGFVSNSLDRCNPSGVDTITTAHCGSLKSRLKYDTQARVAFTDGSNMNIRKFPGFDQPVIARVPEGTNIISLYRLCQDNSTWWYVRTKNGIDGWMAEEQNGIYLLEPIP